MREVFFSATVLLCAVILLRAVLGGRISMRLRYGLWLLVLLRLLVPVSLPESPVSVLNVLPEGGGGLKVTVERLTPEQISPGAAGNSGDQAPAAGKPQTAPERERGGRAPTAVRALEAVWLLGACGVGGWFLLVNLRFARRARRERTACPNMSCPVPVYRADFLPSPCLAGLLRPGIYVPGRVLDDSAALEHVLVHELCHLRHGDNLWALLRGVCLTLWWFHPLVWAAAVLSRRDGELACDEAAVERLGEGERIPYGRTLVALAAGIRGPGELLRASTSMTAGKGEMRERVVRLSKRRKMSRVILGATLVLAALLAACTFTGPKGALNGEPEPPDEPAATPAMAEAGTGRKEDYITFLLAASNGRQEVGTLDAAMVGSFDVNNGSVHLVSVPNRTLISATEDPAYQWMTAWDAEEVREAFSTLLDIPIDYYAMLDQEGFGKLVDALGGVDFEVERTMDYDDPTQGLHIHVEKGMQHLDGAQAAMVGQYRQGNDHSGYVDGELERVETQQELLRAILEQGLERLDMEGMAALAGVFSQNVETDLDRENLLWLGAKALSVKEISISTLPGEMAEVRSPSTGRAISCWVLDSAACLELVNESLNPYMEPRTLSDMEIPEP